MHAGGDETFRPLKDAGSGADQAGRRPLLRLWRIRHLAHGALYRYEVNASQTRWPTSSFSCSSRCTAPAWAPGEGCLSRAGPASAQAAAVVAPRHPCGHPRPPAAARTWDTITSQPSCAATTRPGSQQVLARHSNTPTWRQITLSGFPSAPPDPRSPSVQSPAGISWAIRRGPLAVLHTEPPHLNGQHLDHQPTDTRAEHFFVCRHHGSAMFCDRWRLPVKPCGKVRPGWAGSWWHLRTALRVSAAGYRERRPSASGWARRQCPVKTSLRSPGLWAAVRWQSWQRVTGRWVTVTGKRRELELLITSVMPGPPQ